MKITSLSKHFSQWIKLRRISPHLFAWVLLCLAVGIIALIYLSMGLKASQGALLMPLDDTYIHFQYARQMANGEPYIYSPGDEPTSGATSFLYTPLLAIGYGLGFHEEALAYWAVGVGVLCFLGSAWLIYCLVLMGTADAVPRRSDYLIAIALMLAFVISGPLAWAAFSGMETALFVFAVLAALYAYCRFLAKNDDVQYVMVTGALAALSRPEGVVVALSLVLAVVFKTRKLTRWLAVPILAVLVQPAVNWMVTGTPSATGNQAKSLLYNTTIPLSERLENVLDYWGRLWRELFSGHNPVDGRYMPSLLAVLSLVVFLFSVRVAWKTRQIPPALLVGVWLLLMSGGIATLETAFWHFKRYQLPLMALFFPMAGWALLYVKEWATSGYGGFLRTPYSWTPYMVSLRYGWAIKTGYFIGAALPVALAISILLVSSWTTFEYARRYFDNIEVVRNQQVAMAEWVDANLPEDVRIGVHDVGVMAYLGHRATYDLVGLTTEGTAEAWRQGSGAIYDTMQGHRYRPDYFAIYHDIQSLPLLEQAGVFGETLARFTFPLPENTVASATSTQIVSRANWAGDFSRIHQSTTEQYLPESAVLLKEINVADPTSERDVHYRWWNDEKIGGFATVARNLVYSSCEVEACGGVDGTRLISGGEEFDLPAAHNADSRFLIVLRVHARSAARLKSGCGGVQDINVVPNRAGEWLEMIFVVPASEERFCIEVDGIYEPARYWLYEGILESEAPPTDFRALLHDPVDGHALYLSEIEYEVNATAITLNAVWYSAGDLTQDGKVFVHLYNDANQPPLRQLDVWPGDGTLPPANWLAGAIHERYNLPLEGVPPGHYTLAIGFYEPNLQKRYTVTDEHGEADRLFLGEIDIH